MIKLLLVGTNPGPTPQPRNVVVKEPEVEFVFFAGKMQEPVVQEHVVESHPAAFRMNMHFSAGLGLVGCPAEITPQRHRMDCVERDTFLVAHPAVALL